MPNYKLKVLLSDRGEGININSNLNNFINWIKVLRFKNLYKKTN